MPPTQEQASLIDAVRRVLEADTDIEAAWLSGSLGRGTADAFSDVDVLVLAADGKLIDTSARYAADLSAIAETVLVNRLFGGKVLNVVTADWGRFDLSFIETGELADHDARLLSVLFNKTGRAPPHGATAPYQTTPDQVLRLVNEFLRILGLTVVAVGREEYVLGLTGLDFMRRLMIDLMLEENGVGPIERGGALHRNPLLTAEQRHEFETLAPVTADRAGLIAANVALAERFLPRARRLAGRIGMVWPEAFEAATRRSLKDRLQMTFA